MAVLLATTLLIVLTRFLWYRLLPLYLRTLGATDAQVGMVFAVVLLLGPLQLVGGVISDRWGRRHAISEPTLVLAVILVVGALAHHWLQLALAVWFVSVVGNVQGPAFQALLAESATDADRGRVFGAFYMIVALGQMVGPALGALLLPAIDVSGLIWLSVSGAAISGVARLLLLREGSYTLIAAHAATIDLCAILRDPAIRRLIVVNSLFLLLQSLTSQGPFVALHAADSLHMGDQAINLLFAIGGVGATLAALIGGGLADRAGGRRVSAISLVLHGILLVAWGSLPSVTVASYVLFTASWMAAQMGIVAYSAWYSAYAPTAIRGRVLGIVGAVATVASAVGPQVGSWLRTATQSLAASPLLSALPYAGQVASATPIIASLLVAVLLGALVLRMPGRHGAA